MTSEIETRRKQINREQSALRKVLTSPEDHAAATERFLKHHAMLHSPAASGGSEWSYEDALLDDLGEDRFRAVPEGGEHTIAWAYWHITRIEDAAMNLLVAGTPQRLLMDGWPERLGVSDRDSGNENSPSAIKSFSERVAVGILREYRLAVGRRTQEIVRDLQPGELDKKVDPKRLQRVMDEGVLTEAASGIRDYWGRRTIGGLLLMPASRHILTHLNEIRTIKRKLR